MTGPHQFPHDIAPGAERECQIAPYGDFPKTLPDGQTIVQKVDPESVAAIVADWEGRGSPEILLDFEHFSLDPSKSSSAAAWVKNLRADPEKGLVGTFCFTDTGAAAVANRRLRFPSAVWNCDPGTGRPWRLISIGLTNTPNIPGQPLVNRETHPGGPNPPPTKKEPNMKELAALYGLPETATEADILAAAQAEKEKAASLEARLAELEGQALGAEADQFLAANAAKIADPAAIKALYIANKAAAVAAIAAVKAPVVVNKAAAQTPAGVLVANKLEVFNAMKPGAEKTAYFLANKAELLAAQLAAARK